MIHNDIYCVKKNNYYNIINYYMSSFTQYDNAFDNSDNDKLDRLARQVNEDKKKLHKKIRDSISNTEANSYVAMDCLMDPNNARFAQNLSDFTFFSTQGDFSSKLPTPMEQYKKNKYGDSDSIFTPGSSNINNLSSDQYSFSDISSEYSSLPQKVKKHLKSQTSHLKKYSESEDPHMDETKILSHIKKCEQCKNEIIGILKSNDENKKIIEKSNKKSYITKQNDTIYGMTNFELKNVLILILIGVFIIVFIDIFIRK